MFFLKLKTILSKVNHKKYFFIIFFGLLSSNVSAQLHHQMLSSQGSTSKTTSGIVVTQTIGQQSVAGNYTSKDHQIGQGKGAIALQIHDGGGIKVRWRNLQLTAL